MSHDQACLEAGRTMAEEPAPAEQVHAGPATVSITVGGARLTVNLGQTRVTGAELMAALDAAVEHLEAGTRQRTAA